MKHFWIFAMLVIAMGTFGCPGYFEFENGEVEEGDGTDGLTTSGYQAEVEPEEEDVEEDSGAEEEVLPPEDSAQEMEPQERLEWFVTVQMMDENGGVRNEYGNGRPYILAETMGQMMEYALLVDDKELFDKEWNFVQEHFIGNEYGLPCFAIWADNYQPKENRSSTDDDMRIVWALYEAEEKWGEGYGYKAAGEKMAGQMAEHNQYLNILSKGFTWDESGAQTSTRMDIDDLRWEVMQTLAEDDPIWRVMVVKTNQQFLTCQDQSNGLFWQEYDIVDSRPEYPVGKDVCRTSHMLRGGMYYSDYKTYVPATTLHNKMKTEWEKTGKISSAYHMENLGTGNGVEEMETYALAGRNAIRLGDCNFAVLMRERVLMEQIDDTASPIYGSVSKNRKENGIEDDIDTLLLLEELERCEPNQ